MSEHDLLDQLLHSHPTAPATKGEVVLLRMETKSEFHSLHRKIDQKFEKIDEQFEKIDQRFEKMDQRFEKIDQRFGEVDQKFEKVFNSLDLIARQVAVLVQRSDRPH